MPFSLKTLVRNRRDFIASDEENLEQGRVWVFTPSNVRTNFHTGFCWTAPAAGTAVIEVWGAGGSGARMCCCGRGLPGNSGAYVKRTIEVATGNAVSGVVGFSCGNADAICFRGCSTASCVCWISSTTDGCICAQGGAGGRSFCSTGSSLYCCFLANGYCTTGPYNVNCGKVCNYFPGIWIACGYGGDVNCCGGFSCTSFLGCLPSCPCATQYHMATPPGKFSTGGAVITFTTEADSGADNWTGMGANGYLHGLGVAGKNPSQGIMSDHRCWTGGRTCGCYEANGCIPFSPPGFPGMAAVPCGDHRSVGYRGGHGAVRIKFIAADTVNYL